MIGNYTASNFAITADGNGSHITWAGPTTPDITTTLPAFTLSSHGV